MLGGVVRGLDDEEGVEEGCLMLHSIWLETVIGVDQRIKTTLGICIE